MFNCKMPIDAVLAVTYKCNAKCKMCDIWQIKNHEDMAISGFLKLPQELKYINISGGEPFLHPQILEIIQNIKKVCPKSNIIFSSNGLATELIYNKIQEILKIDSNIGVSISIDGIGKTHDQIRGIDGAYDKALQTIYKLKHLEVKKIKIAFTLTNDNLDEMKKVFDLSCELGVEFTMSAMQNSDIYFGNKKNVLEYDKNKLQNYFDYIIKKELKTWSLKKWARAYYVNGLYFFLIGKGRKLPIEAGHAHFFMDPNGNIYPSVVDNQLMGNLSEVDNFKEIWCVDKNNKLRKKLKNGLAQPSWMICTARTAIRRHPIKVGLWVLKNKFLFI
ncbi:MAG: radical SAM protein [Patescibacteria group bacterium]